MPSWYGILKDEEIEAIWAYIRATVDKIKSRANVLQRKLSEVWIWHPETSGHSVGGLGSFRPLQLAYEVCRSESLTVDQAERSELACPQPAQAVLAARVLLR